MIVIEFNLREAALAVGRALRREYHLEAPPQFAIYILQEASFGELPVSLRPKPIKFLEGQKEAMMKMANFVQLFEEHAIVMEGRYAIRRQTAPERLMTAYVVDDLIFVFEVVNPPVTIELNSFLKSGAQTLASVYQLFIEEGVYEE